MELQREIWQKHKILITSYSFGSKKAAGFREFLNTFLNAAETLNLSDGHNTRFIPLEGGADIKIVVHREDDGWYPEGVSLLGPDIAFEENNLMHAGHKSALAVVRFIIQYFPKRGTREARYETLRSHSLRADIMGKVKTIENYGIKIEACEFSIRYDCRLFSQSDIAYLTQEQFPDLTGLVQDVAHGLNTQKVINITIDNSWRQLSAAKERRQRRNNTPR